MSIYRVTLMETSVNSTNEVKYFPDTDARCVKNTFTEASSRTPITSGEQLNVAMGKISRYLKDIQTHAFTSMDAGTDTSPASSKSLNSLKNTVNTMQTDVDNGKLKYGTSIKVENEKLYLVNMNGTKLNTDGVKVVSESFSTSQNNTLKTLLDAKFNTTGGTLSGDIHFPDIGDTATSKGIYWSGSSDGAGIFYRTDAKDAGRLVLNLTDDTNTRIDFALNGTTKSYIDANGNFSASAAKVNGHTVNSDVPSGAKFTDTNTWRPVINNLTTSETGSSLDAAQGKILNDKIISEAKNYGYVWQHVSNYFGIGFYHNQSTLDVSTSSNEVKNVFLRSNYPIILYCILKNDDSSTFRQHHASIVIIDSLLTQTKKDVSTLTSSSQFRTLEGPTCFGSWDTFTITGNGATASNYSDYNSSDAPASWGSTFWISVNYNIIGYAPSNINDLFGLSHYNRYSYSDRDQLNISIRSDAKIARDIYVLHPANISTVTFGGA